ncbi:uncharacterized protein HD556DRAFT_1438905 [Suillus plorans]|uniref:Uncharacterized protein n=1 Tax=Suillus plorans TaxID=116603 RepID=A0A9P7J3I4_9AGAM|nr:uncharacterized protein HD556DRAFT_1438905 [Suillus plorans]KAG1800906.1 hypothetical protein HD556DRAFT_1438905 [Suillus plorans]
MPSPRSKTPAGNEDMLEAFRLLLLTLNLSSADCIKLASSLLPNNAIGESPTKADSPLTVSAAKANSTPVSLIIGEESPTEANSTLTISTLNISAAKVNSTPTIVWDDMDRYAEIDAALAMGSVLNIHKGVYFNVPVNHQTGVTLYYITRGRKLRVFSGWNKTGPWVSSVSRALYAKADSVEQGIEIVKFAIKDGTAARV